MSTPLPVFRRLLLGLAFLLPALPVVSQPAYLGLDGQGHLSYFDAAGALIQRTKMTTAVPVADYLDLEVLDFLPENAGPEVLLLRRAWWIDVMPMPGPRQAAVRRLQFLRFTPRTHQEPQSLALAASDGTGDYHLHVASRDVEGSSIAWVDRFAITAPTEGRSLSRVSALRWPVAGGWTELAPGLLNPGSAWAGVGPAGLETATWSEANGLTIRQPVSGAPTVTGPVRLRLLRDRLYLLENGTTLHRWQQDGVEWKSAGAPLRLRATVPLVALVPLRR